MILSAKALYKKYLSVGAKASLSIIPDARHEILNENEKEKVMQDMLEFLDK